MDSGLLWSGESNVSVCCLRSHKLPICVSFNAYWSKFCYHFTPCTSPLKMMVLLASKLRGKFGPQTLIPKINEEKNHTRVQDQSRLLSVAAVSTVQNQLS
ncbi:eukaryotic translation initiation factor 4E [Platysternon megacephalum]|uniref:Eukaryotic translation initiation factor 4E n=1 Tax=Platysternon megacephalum TaxID=55544 RepID=A0A4D9EZZ3_9SAUR|nr:eukaryotic translation initiation factor 4E [Platysternon megacephalum]